MILTLCHYAHVADEFQETKLRCHREQAPVGVCVLRQEHPSGKAGDWRLPDGRWHISALQMFLPLMEAGRLVRGWGRGAGERGECVCMRVRVCMRVCMCERRSARGKGARRGRKVCRTGRHG